MEKYRTAGQTTDDSMAQAHCVLDTNATNAHPEYAYLLLFQYNSGCMNAPQCYAVRLLAVMLQNRSDMTTDKTPTY